MTTQIRGEQIKNQSIDSDQIASGAVDSDHINWGGSSTQVNAGDIPFPTGHSYPNPSVSTVMAALEELLLPSHFIAGEAVGVGDGSTTVFSLDNTPEADTEEIYLNGQLLEPGAGNDYTISGADITFESAPDTNDKIAASYIKA